MKIFKKIVTYMAMEKGKWRGLYVRFCKPTSEEYGVFMARHGGLFSVGENTSITVGINITDPAYVRVGKNCTLSCCTLLGHDGVVRILNAAYGKKLDSVGKIDILDNSFVGHGAIVMPGVTIGPNSIVAAGSVVTKDIPPGVVVGGVPAKFIETTEALVARLEAKSALYPWKPLIDERVEAFDPLLEPQLKKMRVAYFYGERDAKHREELSSATRR